MKSGIINLSLVVASLVSLPIHVASAQYSDGSTPVGTSAETKLPPVGQGPTPQIVYVFVPTSPTSSRNDPSTFHVHDGFYLRMSFGAGYFWNSGSIYRGEDFTADGAVLPISISIGGTPSKGFVFGGTLGFAYLPRPTITLDGKTQYANEPGTNQTGLWYEVGPFIDVYPNPTKGFRIHGAITFAYLDKPRPVADESSDNAAGIAFSGGVGYDLWIGNQWSVGVLGKLTYGSLSTIRHAFGVNNQSFISPSLMVSFVYH